MEGGDPARVEAHPAGSAGGERQPPRPRRPRVVGNRPGHRTACPRPPAQADLQDRRGAPAQRRQHLWLLRGDRRADFAEAARSPSDRDTVGGGAGTPREAREGLPRRIVVAVLIELRPAPARGAASADDRVMPVVVIPRTTPAGLERWAAARRRHWPARTLLVTALQRTPCAARACHARVHAAVRSAYLGDAADCAPQSAETNRPIHQAKQALQFPLAGECSYRVLEGCECGRIRRAGQALSI